MRAFAVLTPHAPHNAEFADESPEYFDSYAEVKTQYSQVYWTRSPNIPLPPDIVKRFEGKVMAITGCKSARCPLHRNLISSMQGVSFC